jgi:hypothetical protein
MGWLKQSRKVEAVSLAFRESFWSQVATEAAAAAALLQSRATAGCGCCLVCVRMRPAEWPSYMGG